MNLVKFLRMTAKHLHEFAMCGVTDDIKDTPDQRRIHYIAVRALQEAARLLETAVEKIETGARP